MIKTFIKVLIILILVSTQVYSAGTDSSDSKVKKAQPNSNFDSATIRIDKAKKLEAKGKIKKSKKTYKEALKYLYKANKEKPLDPDILNYLGFANRKIDNVKDAEIYYLMGLEIDPTHNGINEYLGELYVLTNRVSLAKERLNILKSCNCEEYQELKDVIDGVKKSKY